MSYQTVRDRKGDIPQFQAQRTTPIYEYVTRKFYCEENIVGDIKETQLTQLSWNIHTPQDDFVWKSVKLHIPLKIIAKTQTAPISMRLADRFPACNVALCASPMKMFTDCQLILNGSMFSIQPNFYESILDTCYQSRDENSWMSSHSLKPNANRNLKRETESNGIYALHGTTDFNTGDDSMSYVQIHDGHSSVSDHAFDLTFANPGYNSRVRSWQTDLQGSSSYCQTEIISYLHIGPFMRRVRKMPNGEKQYNTAVPFLKDFSLKLILDKQASEYDNQKGNVYNEAFPGRVLPSSVLEWGTPCNMRHVGETEMPDQNWADYFSFEITSKPYLEVEYVKLGENNLANSYKLRALDYQHEKSDPFSFDFPLMNSTEDRLVASTVPVRISSRLLEVPSKIYVWCELAHEYKKSFFLGGTQRCARLENFHLRIGNRSDILFEPTQLSLFDNFKKLTSNSWGLSTWEKSPIYVFDPASFGLEEYLSGQSQLLNYEWNIECTPTELMIEEFMALEKQRVRKSLGYIENISFLPIPNQTYTFGHAFGGRTAIGTVRKYQNWIPNPLNSVRNQAQNLVPTEYSKRKLFIPTANKWVSPHQSVLWLEFLIRRNQIVPSEQLQMTVQGDFGKPLQEVWTTALENYVIKAYGNAAFANKNEIMKIKKVTGHRVHFDGMAWALCNVAHVDANGDQDFPLVPTSNVAGQSVLWYVPESYPLSLTRDDYQKPIPNTTLHFQAKRLFNRINDYDFATNTWAVGKLPVWEIAAQAGDPAKPGDGFISGHITQLPADGSDPETVLFNSKVSDISSTVPGMRAFPYDITNNAVVGIKNHGDVDGGAYNAQAPHYVVRGGQRPIANRAINGDPAFMYNSNNTAAVQNNGRDQSTYKWICFQLSDDAHTGLNQNLNGTFIASNGTATQQTATNIPTGDIQDFQRHTNGDRISAILGFEVHMLQCVLERNVFNSRTDNGFVDYSHLPADAQTSYGALARVGQSLTTSASKSVLNTETNSLRFETCVLYEYGMKNYIITRDGKMAQDYPGIAVNDNLVQGRNFVKDKRLSNYQNTSTRELLSAVDEFNTQG